MRETSAIEIIRADLDRSEENRSPHPASVNEYAQLKHIIKQQGLLDKQPRFYTYKILLTVGLLAAGIVFFVHQMLFGLYLGSTFAPNHKGMLILEKSSPLDFLRRQVLTARNVYAHPWNDFWYGGLNYQIEHHLFPSMPRNNLKKAQRIVKAFCQEHEISYYETSSVQSYKEILSFLHGIGAPLRKKKLPMQG